MKPCLASGIALVTGFAFLSFELLYVRVFSIAGRGRATVFGIVLGVFLLGLGLGAGSVRRLLGRPREGIPVIVFRLLVISALACYLVIPGTVLLSSLRFYAHDYGLLLVFAAACSFGGILPLLVRAAVDEETRAGSRTALVYAANITGSALGCLATGYVLLDALPLADVALLMAGILLLLAVVVSLGAHGGMSGRWIALPPALLLLLASIHGPLHVRMYEKLQYMPRSKRVPPFEMVIENRNGVIAVTPEKRVYSDGSYDGVISTALAPRLNPEIENAYLAFLVHPRPRAILEIGLATGSWAQVLVHGPGVETLTAVEINPGYLRLISRYGTVRSLLTNSRFTSVIDDGRRWLRRNPGRSFDLIVMNTTFHWRSHATDLLSGEFMKLCKRHLNPGGVLYINTTQSGSAIRTVAMNFKHAAMHTVYVIASDAPFRINRARFRKILEKFAIDGKPVLDLRQAGHRRILEQLVSLRLQDLTGKSLEKYQGSRLVTDDNMVTEFSPGR